MQRQDGLQNRGVKVIHKAIQCAGIVTKDWPVEWHSQ